MEIFEDILKIAIPAALVLYGMYLVMNTLVSKQLQKIHMDTVSKNQEQITPLRLQAYERVVLLLERISPPQLVLRVNDPNFNVRMFRQQLIASVREEYNHNLSQQVYVSKEAWNLVKNAVEDVQGLINSCAQNIEDQEDHSQQLGLLILRMYEENETDSIGTALNYVKDEVQQMF